MSTCHVVAGVLGRVGVSMSLSNGDWMIYKGRQESEEREKELSFGIQRRRNALLVRRAETNLRGRPVTGCCLMPGCLAPSRMPEARHPRACLGLDALTPCVGAWAKSLVAARPYSNQCNPSVSIHSSLSRPATLSRTSYSIPPFKKPIFDCSSSSSRSSSRRECHT